VHVVEVLVHLVEVEVLVHLVEVEVLVQHQHQHARLRNLGAEVLVSGR